MCSRCCFDDLASTVVGLISMHQSKLPSRDGSVGKDLVKSREQERWCHAVVATGWSGPFSISTQLPRRFAASCKSSHRVLLKDFFRTMSKPIQRFRSPIPSRSGGELTPPTRLRKSHISCRCSASVVSSLGGGVIGPSKANP